MKSMVFTAVSSRRSVARNSSQFCVIVQNSDAKIVCSEITPAEIENVRPNLQRLVDGVSEVKKMQFIHCVRHRDVGVVEIAENNDRKSEFLRIKATDASSVSGDYQDSEIQITSHVSFSPNEWTTAIFDDSCYSGIIRSVCSNYLELEISFLKIVGKTSKRP